MMPKLKQLDAREQRFVAEYLKHLCPRKAALASGYAETTASTKAWTWVSESNPKKNHVYAAIQEAKKKRAERTQIDADYVLQRHAAIDAMDIADIFEPGGTVKPIDQWPEIWRQTVSGLEVKEFVEMGADGVPQTAILRKIKWPDKLKNLELMGKHVDVRAFTEQHRHTHGLSDDTVRTFRDVIKGARRKEVKH